MSQLRLAHLGLILAAIGLNMAPSIVGLGSVAQAEALRAAVGTPLQAAKELMGKKKFAEALAKVNEADRVGSKTADESFVIERMRASAASGAGDNEAAAKSFETLINSYSGKLSPKDQAAYVQSLGSIYYRTKNYSKAIQWITRYEKDGGTDPAMHSLLLQAYSLTGNSGKAISELQANVQASEKAGRTPPEDQLLSLANFASKQTDKTAYVGALEKLVAYYPTKDLWNNLVTRVQSKPGFSQRLLVEVYRLKLALGMLAKDNEYMEMALLTLQDGFAAEAKGVLEKGFQAGVLGAAGADVSRQKRLQDKALKTLAENQATLAKREAEATKSKEGNDLVNIGYDYATNGQIDKGISLIEQGIRYGNLKRPEDAKLHLGIAEALAGHKAKAIQTFKTVQGKDGTADLARYWILQLNHPMK